MKKLVNLWEKALPALIKKIASEMENSKEGSDQAENMLGKNILDVLKETLGNHDHNTFAGLLQARAAIQLAHEKAPAAKGV